MTQAAHSNTVERELAVLLTQHYGDGQVYFTTAKDRQMFRVAFERGLVNESGLLTARGRQLVLTVH